jgi:hypothetical protein
MPTIVNTPLQSEYGFSSPSFVVDNEGNITARSITLEVVDEVEIDEVAADHIITEVSGNFRLDGGLVDNAAFTLYRNSSITLDLDTLSTLTFSIYSSISPLTLYNEGLRHSDGTKDADSQGNSEGRLYISLPASAPDTLYYGNSDGSVYGVINVFDPSGLFGDMSITGNTESTSVLTGALTVAGGVGIAKDLYVGGALNIAGVGIPRLESATNLELSAGNKIIVEADGVSLGEINSSGLAMTINNSSIDNTIIGATTPSTGTFTSALVTNVPTTDESVTNKQYVDSQTLSLAIAFGI